MIDIPHFPRTRARLLRGVIRRATSDRAAEKFLEALAESGSTTAAARAAGRSVRTFRYRRCRDPQGFGKDFLFALQQGVDRLREAALDAVCGDGDESSDAQLIATLVLMRPADWDYDSSYGRKSREFIAARDDPTTPTVEELMYHARVFRSAVRRRALAQKRSSRAR